MVRLLTDDIDPNRVPPRLNPGVALKTTAAAGVVILAGWGDPALGAFAAGLVIAILALNAGISAVRARARRSAVASLRPDADLVEAWVPDDAQAALGMAGLTGETRLSSAWATRVTVVLADDRCELWRGGREPRCAVVAPWDRVDAVECGSARIARFGSSPGVRVWFTPQPGMWDDFPDDPSDDPPPYDPELDRDAIVLVPTRRPGSVAAGSAVAANRLRDALAERLRRAGRPV